VKSSEVEIRAESASGIEQYLVEKTRMYRRSRSQYHRFWLKTAISTLSDEASVDTVMLLPAFPTQQLTGRLAAG
jgi:hypothetical protein